MVENNEMQGLELKEVIPSVAVNEGSEVTAIDLNDYINNPTGEALRFTVELVGGGSLPAGINFSADGILSGIPQAGTARPLPYEITIVAFNPKVAPLVMHFKLTIYAAAGKIDYNDFKNYWQNFAEGLALPDIEQLLTREITPLDIYYMLGRFATLIIWNADDLTSATKGVVIDIPQASKLFKVYDFSSAIVTSPSDLYDPNRGLKDAIQTAKAMIREIKRRNWNIELAGYDKMVTAAWVEVQHLNKATPGNPIKVYNYEPSLFDTEVLALSSPQQQI
ncbi:MAG: putative Ig domain-containing protein [Gammaproteobacteria bacterium]|jgi:hypothetical protein